MRRVAGLAWARRWGGRGGAAGTARSSRGRSAVSPTLASNKRLPAPSCHSSSLGAAHGRLVLFPPAAPPAPQAQRGAHAIEVGDAHPQAEVLL